MSLTNRNKINIAFKKIVGKSNVNPKFGSLAEVYGSGVQADSQFIFAEPITGDTTVDVAAGVVKQFIFDLEPIPYSVYNSLEATTTDDLKLGDGLNSGVNDSGAHAYALRFRSSTEELASGYVNGTQYRHDVYLCTGTDNLGTPGQAGRLQIIPDKYGSAYKPLIQRADPGGTYTTIDETSDVDWYLDTYSGILFVQDYLPAPPQGSHHRLTAYMYIGKFVNQKAGDLVNATGILSLEHGGTGANLSVSSTFPLGAFLKRDTNPADSTKLIPLTGADYNTVYWSPTPDLGWVAGPAPVGGSSASYGGLLNFAPSDTVPDAIRDIDSVLAGLAPKFAPPLSNMGTLPPTVLGYDLYLNFDSGTAYVQDYTGVDVNLPPGGGWPNPGQSPDAVLWKHQFSKLLAPGGHYKRLGVYATTTPHTFTLNDATVKDEVNGFTNFPDNAFKVSTPFSPGDLQLYVNGVLVGTLNDVGNVNASQTGTFPTGTSFAQSTWTTGTVTIPTTYTNSSGTLTNSWRPGYNYAYVKYLTANTITNYVDWVYDPALTGSYSPSTTNAPNTSTFLTSTSTRTLSGVTYYTDLSFDFKADSQDFFGWSYNPNGVSFTSVINGADGNPRTPSGVTVTLAASGYGPNNPKDPSDSTLPEKLDLNIPHQILPGAGVRYLGETLTSTLTLTSGPKTGSVSTTTRRILLDNITGAQTLLTGQGSPDGVEDFCDEQYRVPSGSYDSQTLSGASYTTFAQGSDLVCYNGGLRHPSSVTLPSAVELHYPGTGSLPDYTVNYTAIKSYYRKFKNDTSGQPSVIIMELTLDSATGLIAGNPSDQNISVHIKIPTKTGWRDVVAATTVTDTLGSNQFDDNLGARIGPIGSATVSGGVKKTIEVSFISQSLSYNEFYVVRVRAAAAWTGSLKKLTIKPKPA